MIDTDTERLILAPKPAERTKEQVHEGNNAVIAAAKEAAERHGIHAFVAVAGHYGDADGILCGVDASEHTEWPLVLFMASFALGSLSDADLGDDEKERNAIVRHAAKFGAKCAAELWDREVIAIQADDVKGG